MAKHNIFLGMAKGKVGSVVLSRRNGVQITRVYNPSPSNPKTEGQAAQRAIFATAVAAAQGLKSIVNHTFDGVANGQDSINEFVRRNIAVLRNLRENGSDLGEFLVPKGESFIQPNKWQLSNGSQGVIVSNIDDVFNGTVYTLPESEGGWPYVTLSQLRRLWSNFGNGSQLSFVFLLYSPNDDGTFDIKPVYKRIVFNSNVEEWASHSLNGTIINEYIIPSAILDMSKTEGFSLYEGSTEGETGINIEEVFFHRTEPTGQVRYYVNRTGLGDPNAGTVVAYCAIGTNYDNSKSDPWLHTTSYMDVDLDAYDYTVDAIATYMNQAKKIVSSDMYTDQSSAGGEDTTVYTLEELVSAMIVAQGMQAKSVAVGKTNSYGPVAEGNPISLYVDLPDGYIVKGNTIKVYNGENPVSNEWQINRFGNSRFTLYGPMPTTATFQLNLSFDVYDSLSASDVGRAALRVSVSKANA